MPTAVSTAKFDLIFLERTGNARAGAFCFINQKPGALSLYKAAKRQNLLDKVYVFIRNRPRVQFLYRC